MAAKDVVFGSDARHRMASLAGDFGAVHEDVAASRRIAAIEGQGPAIASRRRRRERLRQSGVLRRDPGRGVDHVETDIGRQRLEAGDETGEGLGARCDRQPRRSEGAHGSLADDGSGIRFGDAQQVRDHSSVDRGG